MGHLIPHDKDPKTRINPENIPVVITETSWNTIGKNDEKINVFLLPNLLDIGSDNMDPKKLKPNVIAKRKPKYSSEIPLNSKYTGFNLCVTSPI